MVWVGRDPKSPPVPRAGTLALLRASPSLASSASRDGAATAGSAPAPPRGDQRAESIFRNSHHFWGTGQAPVPAAGGLGFHTSTVPRKNPHFQRQFWKSAQPEHIKQDLELSCATPTLLRPHGTLRMGTSK